MGGRREGVFPLGKRRPRRPRLDATPKVEVVGDPALELARPGREEDRPRRPRPVAGLYGGRTPLADDRVVGDGGRPEVGRRAEPTAETPVETVAPAGPTAPTRVPQDDRDGDAGRRPGATPGLLGRYT